MVVSLRIMLWNNAFHERDFYEVWIKEMVLIKTFTDQDHSLLRWSYQPVFTPLRTSKSGKYGLISSRGVPSSTSAPWMLRMLSVRDNNWTVDMPIGFGRCGYLVVNRPCIWSLRNGLTIRLYPSDLWKTYNKMMCEKPSNPCKPSRYWGNTSTQPDASYP
jgi:hypothetical protein